MESLSIFDLMYDEYKINKPIRLIELFAGYGSQALALKYLGANFEHYKICEWAVNSIIAYASLHRNELKWYGENFCGDLTKEQIAQELVNYGVSIDYSKPATFEQLKRMKEDRLRLCYNSIKRTGNLVDITRVKGTQINVVERERFTYIMTYSYPCQDLSLAGNGAGMVKGSGTRSALLWEVERILSECENKPQILLMENVSLCHSRGNDEDFKKWQLSLEKMGYQNYWCDITSVNYKIPQTRKRCFMVSLLGDFNYKFPKKSKLDLRLKDLLEKNVDEKYYLSDKKTSDIQPFGSYYTWEDNQGNINTQCNRASDENKSSLTVACANTGKVLIKNATKKGYLEAEVGDGIDISSRMETHRGTVQKGMAQTLKTAIEVGVLQENFKIRRLTPRECFRLMGVKDEDIDLVMQNQTDSSGWHLAGDSIVTTCLMAIFGQMLDIDWQEKFNPKEWWKNDK